VAEIEGFWRVRVSIKATNSLERFRGRPIRRASEMIPVCRKSRMHLETRGFLVLSAAVILILREVAKMRLDNLGFNGRRHRPNW
jgi:hypothetical protein